MKKLLMGKSKGIADGIDAMDGVQRLRLPRRGFGEDYNTLRRLTAQEFPTLNKLLPPEVGASDKSRDKCDTPYGEIRTYAEQIFQMLGSFPDD